MQANSLDAGCIIEDFEEALKGKEKEIISIAHCVREILNQVDIDDNGKICEDIETRFDEIRAARSSQEKEN